MISCTDAVRQLWDYLDGTIGEADRDAIEEHLDVCKRCCGEAEFADELRRFLASHTYEELPHDAKDRLTSFLDQI
ncbi:MAG: zf-HC2 domain-containing protein [Actinobacteria bacterium]|nr:zf-HC2 domain-containing protein [Actinomycetota bacterium]